MTPSSHHPARGIATRTPDAQPWYRQFWPWMLILLPTTSVIAGVTTLFIAMHDPDGLVVDDYYKAGLAINQTLQRRDEARRLGVDLSGRLDLVTGDVTLDAKGRPPAADRLSLYLAHATRSQHDHEVELRAIAGGRYAGQLEGRLRPGAWTAVAEPADGSWRVTGRAIVDAETTAVSLSLTP